MGLLRITGTLDLTQFYPSGQSDGDTAHLTIDLDTSFTFQGTDGGEFRVTTAFADATVSGRDGRKAVIDKRHRIDVRFQGIDAPELHFRPTFSHLSPAQKEAVKEVNKNFRQPFGASAAIALSEFLQTLGEGELRCRLETQVDAPNDVCDTYPRVVGDLIVVDAQDNETNLNRWLIEHGWAFPAFYTSTTSEEILPLRDLGATARTNNLGFWPSFTNMIEFPDPDLVFVKTIEEGATDDGPVLFPKYFRRSLQLVRQY
jgi:endonuclease YncB( thermonuclease family)